MISLSLVKYSYWIVVNAEYLSGLQRPLKLVAKKISLMEPYKLLYIYSCISPDLVLLI